MPSITHNLVSMLIDKLDADTRAKLTERDFRRHKAEIMAREEHNIDTLRGRVRECVDVALKECRLLKPAESCFLDTCMADIRKRKEHLNLILNDDHFAKQELNKEWGPLTKVDPEHDLVTIYTWCDFYRDILDALLLWFRDNNITCYMKQTTGMVRIHW